MSIRVRAVEPAESRCPERGVALQSHIRGSSTQRLARVPVSRRGVWRAPFGFDYEIDSADFRFVIRQLPLDVRGVSKCACADIYAIICTSGTDGRPIAQIDRQIDRQIPMQQRSRPAASSSPGTAAAMLAAVRIHSGVSKDVRVKGRIVQRRDGLGVLR